MIPANLIAVANHLWQSTLFVAAAGLLSLALRKNRARVRHGIWLAASVKFLVPFALLVSIGNQIEWRTADSIQEPRVSFAMHEISLPFASSAPAPLLAVASVSSRLPGILIGVWLCGFIAVIFSWVVQWRRIRAAVRAASLVPLDVPIKVMSCSSPLEPGVFGIFRPVLLLPAGILDRLTPAQLQAVLAHELCHARRRDNLAAAVHMLVEALFWFHPLVWWIGSRLVKERERACDEEVLRCAVEPQTYAEGILNVCKFYVESPLDCMSGVTGSDLKKRIEEIMTHRMVYNLNLGKKLLLAGAGIVAMGTPIAIGILNAPPVHAQSQEALSQSAKAPLTFDVASIKPSSGDDNHRLIQVLPGGGLRTSGTPAKFLVTFAYDVRDFQVFSGPGWINTDGFDILAKSERAAGSEGAPDDPRQMTDAQMKTAQEQLREKLQALLADRFQLTVHRETKEQPVYVLVVGKSGSKLQESDAKQSDRRMMMGRGRINGNGVPLEMLTNVLSNQLGRPVIDRTGLKGHFNIKLEWTPDPGQAGGPFGGLPPPGVEAPPPPDPNGPSLFTAVQEQLGLRLESQKGPVDVIVIDRMERPSEN
jgi:bla regulator protein blaR1